MNFARHCRRPAALLLLLTGCSGPTVEKVSIADNPDLVLEKVFTVSLSEPAALAIRCTRDDEPSEVHLVESTTPAQEHVLRVQGLIAETDYSCVVAPVGEARSVPTNGTFTTGALPASIPSATAESNGTPGAAYTFMPHQRLVKGELSIRLILMDNDGLVRWYYPLPIPGYADMGAEYWGDGLFLWGGVSASDEGAGAPRLVSVSHEEVYRADYPGAAELYYHHIAEKQPDGTVVTLVEADASDGEQEYYGFEVHQVDVETDTLVWSWSLQRAVDDGTLTRGDANWAGIMTEADGSETMVVSLCEGFTIFGIDMDSGAVSWTLAPDGTLDLGDGDPPRCQHGLDVDGQKLLVYDNGAQPTSRAVEYDIDVAAGTATETWSWTEDGWRELAWGDVDYLGEDRVVITKGHVGNWGEGPTQIIELDRTDDTEIWRLSFTEEADAVYSADRIDGCELFAETSRCPSLAARLEELSEWF